MIPLRHAALNEVLLHCPDDNATREICSKNAPYRLWSFDRAGAGQVGGQLPLEHDGHGQIGPLASLVSGWSEWLRKSHPKAVRDRATHEHFLGHLRSGKEFEKTPILYAAPGHTDRHILDGRHRLFAFLEHAQTTTGATLSVYWSDLGRRVA